MGTARRRKPNCTALQRAVRVVEDNEWGPRTDRACSILNHADDGQFPYGVKATQHILGVTEDGVWGPESKIAVREAVAKFQEALTAMGFDTQGVDGFWGPNTQEAFYSARDSHHPYDPPERSDD